MADADWIQYRRLRGRDLPITLMFRGQMLRQEKLFKHDFYAATALYRRLGDGHGNLPERVVVKVYHTESFMFVPLRWLGRWLCNREAAFHERLTGVEGIPRLFGRFGESGLVREYLPGCHLREHRAKGSPDERFFPKFAAILTAIHARGISHNDLSKPENILVGPDGSPALIDFQIATSFWRRPVPRWFAEKLQSYFQWVDKYHMVKHHRRLRPADFTPAQRQASQAKGVLLTLHCWLLRRPYRAVRHFLLGTFLKKDTGKENGSGVSGVLSRPFTGGRYKT